MSKYVIDIRRTPHIQDVSRVCVFRDIDCSLNSTAADVSGDTAAETDLYMLSE